MTFEITDEQLDALIAATLAHLVSLEKEKADREASRKRLRAAFAPIKEGDGTHPNQMGPWS